jgi:hypothetical protein
MSSLIAHSVAERKPTGENLKTPCSTRCRYIWVILVQSQHSHSGICGAADEAVLKKVLEKRYIFHSYEIPHQWWHGLPG